MTCLRGQTAFGTGLPKSPSGRKRGGRSKSHSLARPVLRSGQFGICARALSVRTQGNCGLITGGGVNVLETASGECCSHWSAASRATEGQRAHVIYACVTSIGNIAIVASASASCPPGGTKISWNVTGPAGPAGSTGATGPQGKPGQAIAARQYNCATQVVAQSQFVTFTDSGVGFGTTLPTSTMPFTTGYLSGAS